MSLKTILLIIVVPILNIGLNFGLKITAQKPGSYIQALSSKNFFYSFAVGVASVLCILALYKTCVPLSRGILLMGAISILGGSLFGVYFRKETLTEVEWIIFVLIAAMLIYRFIWHHATQLPCNTLE